MYSNKAFDNINHPPIFIILSSSNLASFIAHALPARFECASILSSGIFLLRYPSFAAENFIWKLTSLYVTPPLPTLFQCARKIVVPSDVCTRICATCISRDFTGHENIFPFNDLWCTQAPLNDFFCSVMRNVAATNVNSYCLLASRGRGESKPQFFSVWKMWRHPPKIVEFLVVAPFALVYYITQSAKYNKMTSFKSLPPLATVEIFLSYVPICIASPESQDALPASLLVVGLFFQTLWACVEAVRFICSMTHVSGSVVALCPGKSSRWYLQVLHVQFQLVPVFHSRGFLFSRVLKILLQPLFWFGNRLPPSIGQCRGVCNRHTRAAKKSPYLPKSLPLSYRICLYPQLRNQFHTQREGKAEA